MRFPVDENGKINIEELKKMVDVFIQKGFVP